MFPATSTIHSLWITDKEYVECPARTESRVCQDVWDAQAASQDLALFARNGFGGYGAHSGDEMEELESEGCFCPKATVLLDGKCQNELNCDRCYVESLGSWFEIDASWDENCQRCICTEGSKYESQKCPYLKKRFSFAS